MKLRQNIFSILAFILLSGSLTLFNIGTSGCTGEKPGGQVQNPPVIDQAEKPPTTDDKQTTDTATIGTPAADANGGSPPANSPGGVPPPTTGGGNAAGGGQQTNGTASSGGTAAMMARPCYQFAYVSDQDGAQNVYLLPCNSSTPQKLTDNKDPTNFYDHITFSPDGQRVYFDVSTPVFGLIHIGIMYGNLPRDNPVDSFLYNDSLPYVPFSITWSPDGNQIAFAAFGKEGYYDQNKNWVDEKGQQVIKLDSDNPLMKDWVVTVVPPLSNTPHSIDKVIWWSRIGMKAPSTPGYTFHKLLFSELAQGTLIQDRAPDDHMIFGVLIKEKDTGGIDSETAYIGEWATMGGISTYVDLLRGHDPALSPNKKSLAFVRNVADKNQIFTCELKSPSPDSAMGRCEDPKPLTTQGNNAEPCFSATGASIYFTSDRDGKKKIYRMFVNTPEGDTNKPMRVTNNDQANEMHAGCYPIKAPIDKTVVPASSNYLNGVMQIYQGNSP